MVLEVAGFFSYPVNLEKTKIFMFLFIFRVDFVFIVKNSLFVYIRLFVCDLLLFCSLFGFACSKKLCPLFSNKFYKYFLCSLQFEARQEIRRCFLSFPSQLSSDNLVKNYSSFRKVVVLYLLHSFEFYGLAHSFMNITLCSTIS